MEKMMLKQTSSVYEVIIIGGGPTGIAMAIELGLFGIKTLVLEKHATPMLSPRAQFLNARTMEFMERWQVAASLKAQIKLPKDLPLQGVWCSKLNGITYATVNANGLSQDESSES